MAENERSDAGYEPLEHTADIRIRVWAPDLPAFLRTAAEAMADQILDRATVAQTRAIAVRAEGADREELLVSWLEEVLSAFEIEGLAVGSVEPVEADDNSVSGVLKGEDFDSDKHEVRNVIKAVTWHDLEVRETDRGIEAVIVFDV